MMRRNCILIGILLIVSAMTVEGQSFERYKNRYKRDQQRFGQLGIIGGFSTSSYVGDLKDSQFSLDARPSISIGAKMRYNTRLSIRSEFSWYRIAGSDANQPVETGLPSRNLSFRADNIELNAVGMLHAFPRYRTHRSQKPILLNPYVFLGLGATSNNPTAVYEGKRHNLRPLRTQGINYGAIAFVVPFGFGIDFRINDRFDFGVEAGYRIALSDQLDDSSRPDYVNRDLFYNPIAAALSDRRNEVGIIPGAPIGAGVIRGNPKVNDGYFLLGFKVQYFMPMVGIKMTKYKRAKGG